MSIINPNIQKILRQAGLDKSTSGSVPSHNVTLGTLAAGAKFKESEKERSDLEVKLDAAGLSLDEVLADLSTLARNGGTEAIRIRALENALRAHGVNKDQAPAIPTINIIIHDPNGDPEENNFSGINPILIPRKMHKQKDESEEEETIN